MYFFIFTSNLFPVIFILNSFLNVCYTYFYKSVFTLKHVYIRGNKPFSYVTLFQKKNEERKKRSHYYRQTGTEEYNFITSIEQV